jgi:exopolysaccharide biosynthesis protein
VHRLVLPSVFVTGLAVFGGAAAVFMSGADADTTASAPGPQAIPAVLSLGGPGLTENRTERQIAPGIVLTTIERGAAVDGSNSGPWVIHALTIDPKVSKGRLTVARGETLGDLEKTGDLLKQAGALVGISGGFFSPDDKEHPGDPMGLAIVDGRVVSEPTGLGSEVTLLVDSAKNTMKVGRLRWSGTVRNTTTGQTLALDGVNRAPVTPEGGSGELSVITSDFGTRTPSGAGTEVVLDRAGCVVKVAAARGTTLAAGQSALQAVGSKASELRALTGNGCLTVEHQVTRGTKPVKLTKSMSATSGRVFLVDEGKVTAPERADRYLWKRHPRSVAGYTWDGKLVLMTIDGRVANSVGTTMVETAQVAQELGVRDAVNLDGGRSATMVVDGTVVSGFAKQRGVGDALAWVPVKDTN